MTERVQFPWPIKVSTGRFILKPRIPAMPADKQESDAAFKLTHLASHISHSETDVGGGTRPSGGRVSEVPKTFGKYQLIRLLGEGGMGAVYLARDTELERDVALKLPKIKGTKSGEVLDRFRREARTAATLNHPNVCPMYEFGELDGQFFLTMAYVDGEPLSYYTKKTKAIAARQVALLIRKLAMALAHAHAKGIIHRDLKPGNVMINKKAEPIVMDFGLARRDASEDTRLTQTGAFVGTPAYVSPEQITNRKGEVDHRTDIYSLGVMLYEMLAQRLPYEAENAMNMMAQVLTGTPDPPTVHRGRACPRLSEIAMKAITRDVTQRYQTMKEVADDLTAYLKGDRAPRADLSESAARIATGFGDEVYQTAALDVENIDFLSFDFKDYGLGETVSPRSKTAAGNRDSRTSTRGNQTRSSSTASAGSSARRSRSVLEQRRPGNSGNKSLMFGLGGIAAFLAIALGIFLTIRTKHGTVRIEIPGASDNVMVSVDGETISLEVLEKGYTIEVGPHAMTVKADGFVTETKEFTVSKGEEEFLTVKLTPSAPQPSPAPPNTGSSRSPIAVSTSDPGFDAFLGKGKWKWSDPEPVMSGFADCHTFTVSSDACTLIVSSWRLGGVGDKDLWISRRVSALEPWPELKNMGATINRKSVEWSPSLSSDGTELYFHTVGSRSDADLFVSTWDPGKEAWTEPTSLPAPVNSPLLEQAPLISPNGLELILWSQRDSKSGCLWQYRRKDLHSPFQSEKSLAGALPSLGGGIDAYSSDALQILAQTTQTRFEIFQRDNLDSPWSNPVETFVLPEGAFFVRYAHAAGQLFFQRTSPYINELWQMRLVDANDESIPFAPVTERTAEK